MEKLVTLKGTVMKGLLMGRKMGFPTINLLYDFLDIPHGVYICVVHTPLGTFRGAMHFGPRESLGIKEPSFEVHLLDFSGDLYGQQVTVDVYDKLRNVASFDSVEGLKKQIRLDVESVRESGLVL